MNGRYQVSNLGRVKSLIGHKKILKPELRTGYYSVNLCKDSKCKHVRIHRLVAEAFIPNIKHLPMVNHKDGNKVNNNVDNLEWYVLNYDFNGKKVENFNIFRSCRFVDGVKELLDNYITFEDFVENIRIN